MFMNTMAVGPEREVEDWVTGGTTVAIERVDDGGGCHGRCGGEQCLDGVVEMVIEGLQRDGFGRRLRGGRRVILRRGRKSPGWGERVE